MAYRAVIVLTIFLGILATDAVSQEAKYKLSPYPDAWYNDVDGIRLGLRLLGEMEGTFKDGPHRLDAGVWVGTKLPDNPVSYYVSFTEPIPMISDYGSEGSIQAISSSRTGYALHQFRINKRWQAGFDELDYLEISMFISQEKYYNLEYQLFSNLWEPNWRTFVGLDIYYSSNSEKIRTFGYVELSQNMNPTTGGFTIGSAEFVQHYFKERAINLRLRSFFGYASDHAPSEYSYFLSFGSISNLNEQGYSRAKGTIPNNWMESGSVHFEGGANVRGYNDQDYSSMNSDLPLQFRVVFGINSELEFPNPINTGIDKISIIGDFLDFKSYAFFDWGTRSERVHTSDPFFLYDGTVSNFGTGFQFSVNIPDYLGKDRGIFIRYDIPFWLSHPERDDPNFKYRDLIGIGAIFSF